MLRPFASNRKALPPPTPTPLPPEGWPSWAAFNRYLADADGGRAPYRQPDPLTIRTIAEAESEMA